jgi:hypothetical protein
MSFELPPLAARVKRTDWPALWLPLFLLWPAIFALFCLALPLCLIVRAPRGSLLAALGATYDLLCALHGTDLELSASDNITWTVSLY